MKLKFAAAVASAAVTALALVLSPAVASTPVPPDSGGGGGWAHAHLSKREIGAVRTGARYIGANKKHVRRVLKRKFRTKNTPVRYSLVTRGPHKAKGITSTTARHGRRLERCGYGVAELKVENYVGWDVATYRMRQRWCWDGERVTDVDPPEYTGTDVHWLGSVQMLSWSEEPTASKDFFDDMTTNSNPHARHSTHRQRRLEFCPFRVEVCLSERAPWLLLSKRYNGTYVPGAYANHGQFGPGAEFWWPK
jgi:hypothetical protein